ANCDAFKEDWNRHPLSGHNNNSPLDICFLSQTEHGFTVDNFPDVHLDILDQYHSVDGNPVHRAPHQTGAGYPDDDPDDESENTDNDSDNSSDSDDPDNSLGEENELCQQIATDVRANIHHKPVKTPQSQSPFEPPVQALFFAALNDIQAAGLIPSGYGLKPSEWVEDEYPASEPMTFRRQKKEIAVELPSSIWLPHAIAWGQALHCMQTFMYQLSDE
ncbi:hypothetical protein K439DRAFT_1324997, partial [Ramaria rubella]